MDAEAGSEADAGRRGLRRVGRGAALAGITALGLASIVGSGGAPGFPDTGCAGEPGGCGGGIDVPPPLVVSIGPARVAAQVGATLNFQVQTNVEQPSYRWCRQATAADACTPIGSATGPRLDVVGIDLASDGLGIGVTVSGLQGSASAFSRIAVSPLPGVLFQDGDFLDQDWVHTTTASPLPDGPTARVSHAGTGGNPGGFRAISYDLPTVPSTVQVAQGRLSAVYDPAALGAIHVIDFTEDCLNLGLSNLLPTAQPMIEQQGRRYTAATAAVSCRATAWTTARRASLGPEDFVRIDGPACASDAACPDFSASGAPIRLGLITAASLSGGLVPPVQAGHGIDNWKATVWRR